MPLFRCGQTGIAGSFVIQLHEQEMIDQARRVVVGEEHTKVHVSGTIVKERRSYNEPWNWHLDPPTIRFFELSAEVCDASMHLVEEDLDKVGTDFLPNSWWCPWSSTVLEEIYEGHGNSIDAALDHAMRQIPPRVGSDIRTARMIYSALQQGGFTGAVTYYVRAIEDRTLELLA